MARKKVSKSIPFMLVLLTIALSASTYAAPIVGVCGETVSRPAQDRARDNADPAAFTQESIGTSTVNGVVPTSIPDGVASDICFSVTVNSPDIEYLDHISFDLPDGWTVNSVGDVAGTGCSSGHTYGVNAGNVVYWQTNGYPPQTGCGDWSNGSYSFCCNVTVPDCTGAPWSIPWNLVGDGWGGTPHSVTGTVSLDCGTVTGQQVLLITPDSTAGGTGLPAARNSSGTPSSPRADISGIVNAIYAYPGYIPVVWNNGLGNPTAADMAPYCVVIIGNDFLWSAGGLDQTAIGNALADYIDGGGKVIETEYIQSYDSWGFAGRYMTDGYSPFTVSTLDNWYGDTMSVVDPTHPVMTGVTSITDNFGQQNPGLRAGTTLLATWSGTGYNAVAVNDDVVAINMLLFAQSSWSGDVPLLLNNALNWLCPSAPPGGCTEIYDNGSMVTLPGGGPGGSDVSRLQTGLLMNTLGFGHALSTGYRIADDFTVTDPAGWQVDEIDFYAYQTGSTTTSTINHVNFRIWDGPPNDAGSAVVFGDTTTNRLISTEWSNIYRDAETSPGNTTRPVMTNTCSAGILLPAGTYWLDWQTGGTLASGPWAPPITVTGQTTTGNALQYNGSTWSQAQDTGTLTPQGIPFTLYDCSGGGGCPTITIDPATLPAATVGVAYSQTLTASGGTAPYTYEVTTGTLPAGLTLNPDTGVISGTPTASGAFTFTITATDSEACNGTITYTIDLGYGWNMSVVDDAGRASACLNTDTGYYAWTALTGFGAGTYVGRSNVTFANNSYFFQSSTPSGMNMKINMSTNKASGSFMTPPLREKSIAIDVDITDNPACP